MLAELWQKSKSWPQKVSTVKVRALVGKEWDLINWDENVWMEHIKSENFETLGT